MIELYVVATLFAVGYLMNQSSKNQKPTPPANPVKQKLFKGEVPSMNSIYDSNYYDIANAVTQKKSNTMINASRVPDKTRVLSRNFKRNEEDRKPLKKVTLLSGEDVDSSQFTHNNMVPFYGGKIRQSVDVDVNSSKLESFTGVIQDYKCKKEVPSFFDKTKDLHNPYGMQNMNDFYQDRMYQSKVRNNVTPIPQVRVGPGINKGYTSEPTGGFHQLDYRDCILPKTVDQLRVESKPKVSYEARTVDGMKAKLAGKSGKVSKNRVPTYYEKSPDMLFTTTGAQIKSKMMPEVIDRETHRQNTTQEYLGGALSQNGKGRKMEPNVRETHRNAFKEFGIRNPALADKGVGYKHDYGKKNILVYANERDVTTTKVYQGNITSAIKAIIAPLEDVLRITKKQTSVNNPRHSGNISRPFPEKPTVYDPNDVMRTTIKETTLQEAILGNLKGHEKLTVYDPNDVMRTTTRETTLQEATLGNLKGHEKLTVYDPNDVMRTTTKETTLQEAMLGNLKGHEKLTVYDPNDVMRTTTKETTLQEAMLGNLKGHEKLTVYDPNDVMRTTIKEMNIDNNNNGVLTGPKQIYIYDPEEVAKKTLRETLERMDYEMNMSAKVYKGKVYDPEDKARTTMKELTEEDKRDYIGSIERMGATVQEGFEPRNTQKQFLSDNEHYGIAGAAYKSDGDGYLQENFDMKNTQKQFLSDNDYYGHAQASTDKKQMSYENMLSAHIRSQKESTLHRREPTSEGAKVFNGPECINHVKFRENVCDALAERSTHNQDRVYGNIVSLQDTTLTKEKQMYDQIEDDRLDPSILKAYIENPYTQPLDSVA